MGVQNWSDDILVAEMADDPQFTEDMAALSDALGDRPANVVMNLSGVSYLNSSNISRLLRLRKQMLSANRRLILSAVTNQLWGVFLITGLDKIFEFTKDVATALATLQLSAGGKNPR